MTRKLTSILAIAILLAGCTDRQPLTLADFVDIGKIGHVKMSNNSGTFDLTPDQLNNFKKEIQILTYEPGFAIKPGSIGFVLTIDGQEHHIYGRTQGQYVEVPGSIVTKNNWAVGDASTLVFKTNGINFDNYQKRQNRQHSTKLTGN